MFATWSLISCLLISGQLPPGAEWPLPLRILRGQELVYHGSFTEECLGTEVQFSRAYRLEGRIFVLDVSPSGSDVALLTTLKPMQAEPPGMRAFPSPETKADPIAAVSVRLELARVSPLGRIGAEPAELLIVSLEGPPTVECGMFVEMPGGRERFEQSWQVSEVGRPLRVWTLAGTETVLGIPCIKVVGAQQSLDWERPRADRTGWRRQDTVWLIPTLGVAQRVERVIERRDPARAHATRRSVLRYDLEPSLQYPGHLYEDRSREITQARQFSTAAGPLLTNPSQHRAQLETLLGKMKSHMESFPPTPYREAILQVKRRVEAGLRGEAEVARLPEEVSTHAAVATLNRPAPDFLAPNFTGTRSARLQHWHGKPVLMAFYDPNAQTAEPLLRFLQKAAQKYQQSAHFVALAMSEDGESIRRKHAEFRLLFPILCGTGLRRSYDIEATPKFVILDSEGIVRSDSVGWGLNTPFEVMTELKRWLPDR